MTVAPTAQNIQGTAATADTTDAGGLFSFASLREGPYTVSIGGDSIGVVWEASQADSVDMENSGDNDILNNIVRRLDTSVQGVVVHDRDGDNTLDPNDMLAGVMIELYRDGSDTMGVTLDTLVATMTTDANGAYSFSGLPEGRYIIKVLQPAGAVVLRGYTGTGMMSRT